MMRSKAPFQRIGERGPQQRAPVLCSNHHYYVHENGNGGGETASVSAKAVCVSNGCDDVQW